ncbi:pentapeptide repeat-containing protein [Bacillus alkalicola]|uniref:Pentapeptide repeat-containing protein n=1 Tax=Evansella alkalicola TaxID=745819 RepID=A0ABS6JSM1_9BACI|nr:pentapeptide repeat-containing protein [Bacillus alkalicola]
MLIGASFSSLIDGGGVFGISFGCSFTGCSFTGCSFTASFFEGAA